MAAELTIKNTFLALSGPCEAETRRSSSLPRSWKPLPFESWADACDASEADEAERTACWADACDGSEADKAFLPDSVCGTPSQAKLAPRWADACDASEADEAFLPDSVCGTPSQPKLAPRWADACDASEADEASTIDSDNDLCTEYEYEMSWGEKQVLSCGLSSGDSDGTTSEHNVDKTVTLSLCDAIVVERTKLRAPRSTKLSSNARLFEPSMPRDTHNVLMAVHAALRASPKILNVQMTDGKIGGTTTILGSHARGALKSHEFGKLLSMLKSVLLNAASTSENTYVMGYLTKPFKFKGQKAFGCKLGFVSAMQHESTCWDTYRQGTCPRQSTCRWCHPLDSDLVNVVVMLSEVDRCQKQIRYTLR